MTVQTLSVTDSTGATQVINTQLNPGRSTSSSSAPVVLASDDLAVTALNKLVGSVGTDYSINTPSLPVIGANFGSTGVYANYTLVATVAANTSRSFIDVENLSGVQVVLIRDDGTAATSAAPNNASLIVLGAAPSAGAAGYGSWGSNTFKGRLQVFVPTGTTNPQICIFAD